MRNGEVFEDILADIKSVKIQGAEDVCRAGIKAYLLNPTFEGKKKILSVRPTEPLLKNALSYIDSHEDKNLGARRFLSILENAHKTVAIAGANLIKNDMNVYSHCHSSTVIDILKYAKKVNKKKFVVYTTEVEPLLQGRKTAIDLSKAGIKVVIAPDLAAEQTMKNCDLFLFGVDAFTPRFVANKLGTSMLCKLAKEYKIPRYSCGVSLKFTKKVKIEKRNPKEVWEIQDKRIEILNPAFDKTRYKFLSGIISEYGILTPKQFVKKVKNDLKKN